MKNNLLFATALVLILTSCNTAYKATSNATPNTSSTININEKGQAYLVGLGQEADLQKAPFAEWYDANYDDYKLDKDKVKKCKGKTEGVTVKAFMATWCGDSKREVPRFYKTLDAIGLEESQVQLVNVERKSPMYKQSPTHEERGLAIHRVPTFIFYKDGKEIGRIVESPVSSLETDIAQILNDLPSVAKYQVANDLGELFAEKGVAYVERNMEDLAKKYHRKAKNSGELNTYGYVLKDMDKEAAHCVFEMNTRLFPKDANTHDSLGELYAEIGEKEKALACYEKALSLSPEDERVQEIIEGLK